MNSKNSWVYIMASKPKGTLYIGVTSSLERRVFEHKQSTQDGFTKKYAVKTLVYYEHTDSIVAAIEREKQLKGWRRSKKIGLIESTNPNWNDLDSSASSE